MIRTDGLIKRIEMDEGENGLGLCFSPPGSAGFAGRWCVRGGVFAAG